MSNQNEQDNRQMTPIAEAIVQIRKQMFSTRDCNRSEMCRGINEGYESAIEVLESILPKEKEMFIDGYRNGALDYASGQFEVKSIHAPVKMRKDAEEHFLRTFNPHE